MASLHTHRESQRGVALVLVLWVIMLMTVIAASFTLTVKRELDVVRNYKEQAQAAAAADAGIQLAMLVLSAASTSNAWQANGSVYEIIFEEARVRLQIQDESGKFDINSVSEESLVLLMQKAGVEEEQSLWIAGAIIDWRDEDNETGEFGAEESEYLRNDYPYVPRNNTFQSLQELQLVMGMTPDLYRAIEPMVTIYTKASGIDPTMASKEVLLSLPDIDENVVEDYLETRQESIENNEAIPSFPSTLEGSATSGSVFNIRAEALMPNGSRATRIVVLGRGAATTGLPFAFLSWEQPAAGDDSLFSEDIIAADGFMTLTTSNRNSESETSNDDGESSSDGLFSQ